MFPWATLRCRGGPNYDHVILVSPNQISLQTYWAAPGPQGPSLARMLLNFSPYSWQPGGIMQLQLYLPATL